MLSRISSLACRRLAAVRSGVRDVRERGAVLAMVAATLLVVLISGALAVDISALERQGQTLQNTADAAALAGVATWVETGDETTAQMVIIDLIQQNGIDLSEVDLDIDFPNSTTIEVDLVDNAPDRFLGSVVGVGDELGRDATAQLDRCDDGCDRIIEVPEPFQAVLSQGVGDGYIPIPIGNRLYSVNHHDFTMKCLDRDTMAECWPAKQLFNQPAFTFNTVHQFVHGTKIYFVGTHRSGPITYSSMQAGDELRLGCFDTATDTPCPIYASMPSVGQGTVYGTPDGIYIFTSSREVYCFHPDTMLACSGYSGGKPSALMNESGWGAWNTNRAWNMDRQAHDGKVYVGLTNPASEVWIHCWNTNTDAPCPEFTPRHANNSTGWAADWVNGRMFFFRETDGTPRSLCSIGNPKLFDCWYLSTGTQDAAAEASMSVMAGSMGTLDGYIGITTYHPPSNRLFLVGDLYSNETHCYDFNTGANCGTEFWYSPWGEVWPYGYVAEGNCLIGLGHKSIFHSLQVDMSGPCTSGSRTVDIEPCMCSGEVRWPPIEAINLDNVGSFDLRVLDPDGNVLIPEDGEGWVSILGTELSLEGIDTSFEYLTLELSVGADGSGWDPWVNDPPSLLIGIQDKDPRLVE